MSIYFTNILTYLLVPYIALVYQRIYYDKSSMLKLRLYVRIYILNVKEEWIMKSDKTELDLQPKIYRSDNPEIKGNIFYFHGGGLLFGSKMDLPKYHIEKITNAGYNIFAFNYYLAPESDFNTILDVVINSINKFAKELDKPYFLWGRSAGAYLCLLSVSEGLDIKPNGIISYYGYGFFKDHWFNTPSEYYLKYPKVQFEDIKNLIEEYPLVHSPVNPRFLLYLYTRQTGKWLEFIGGKEEKEFLSNYSLINKDLTNFPPVFLAHNTEDNDVPYEESIELEKRLPNSQLFTCTTIDHDFDRNTNSQLSKDVIHKTIEFLDKSL